MKKLLLLAVMMLFGLASNAQQENNTNQTAKGNYVIEVNTGSGTAGFTGFRFDSTNATWAAGLDGGYFTMKNLAIKVGLGYYYNNNLADSYNYKLGTEYYINGNIPVGVDLSGTFSRGRANNWLGVQAGYAYFLTKNVSIKPAIRYNMGFKNEQKSSLQGLIGFSIFL